MVDELVPVIVRGFLSCLLRVCLLNANIYNSTEHLVHLSAHIIINVQVGIHCQSYNYSFQVVGRLRSTFIVLLLSQGMTDYFRTPPFSIARPCVPLAAYFANHCNE